MSSNLPRHLLPKTAPGQLALVAALMLGVALVDFGTGLEIRGYPFYFQQFSFQNPTFRERKDGVSIGDRAEE